MGTMTAALQWAFFGALVLSIGVAVVRINGKAADWIERRDIYMVVPDWKFFAPTPNRSDYHIVSRQRVAGGLTDWTIVRSSRRTTFRPRLVDPDRRLRKAAVDVAAHYFVLGRHRRGETAEELRPTLATSMVYLLLLGVVSKVALPGAEVQFAVVATRADSLDPGEIVMISDFHPVER